MIQEVSTNIIDDSIYGLLAIVHEESKQASEQPRIAFAFFDRRLTWIEDQKIPLSAFFLNDN